MNIDELAVEFGALETAWRRVLKVRRYQLGLLEGRDALDEAEVFGLEASDLDEPIRAHRFEAWRREVEVAEGLLARVTAEYLDARRRFAEGAAC